MVFNVNANMIYAEWKRDNIVFTLVVGDAQHAHKLTSALKEKDELLVPCPDFTRG